MCQILFSLSPVNLHMKHFQKRLALSLELFLLFRVLKYCC